LELSQEARRLQVAIKERVSLVVAFMRI